ncbi:MAG: Gfo/Idh/MocA family oxidoreductase [Clostridia bacterium]|nr:Gfo/Idh/MocA family oxidoreductase [Clostridia bacterium]
MKKKVRLAVAGFGERGNCVLDDVLIPMQQDEVEIVAVCDIRVERAQAAADKVEKSGAPRPFVTADYREILKMDTVEAVYIATDWEVHTEIAIAAMKAGKYAGMEVGGTYSVAECYDLVKAYEETGTECMFLENCCYGQRELRALNMVRKGVLGKIVHCSGAYGHDLRKSFLEAHGKDRAYRVKNYMTRNCENYPTHELGPIAKLLDINNGNKFLTLSSFSSSAKGLKEYVTEEGGPEHPLYGVDFTQGDIVTTVLTCSGGQTVILTLDTTLPRYYCRGFTVRGTRGGCFEENASIFLDKTYDDKVEGNWKTQWGNETNYPEYEHPLWKDGVADDMHGGIDHLVFAAFLEAVRTNSHPPIDVYDAATYMCVTALSEQSIAMGGAPVAFPDFTNGKFVCRTDIVENEYTLDRVGADRGLHIV